MSGEIECFYFDAGIDENVVEIGNLSEDVVTDVTNVNEIGADAEDKSKSLIQNCDKLQSFQNGRVFNHHHDTLICNNFNSTISDTTPTSSSLYTQPFVENTNNRQLTKFINATNQQTILIKFNSNPPLPDNKTMKLESDDKHHVKPFLPLGLKTCFNEISKHRCTRCSYQACYSKQLEEHLCAYHMSEAHLKCMCCHQMFFQEDELKLHYQENHPKCYCSECGFTSRHGYMMKRHKQSHSEEGRKCLFCGKLYKDRYVLNMHVKMVHSSVERSFTCTMCSKSFNRKAHLVRHERTHAQQKAYTCLYPNCSYSASERSDLSKHLLVHGEPKFKCQVCNKQFRQSKNRDLHLKRHTGQRDYKCGWCNFYGYTFTDIRKHIQRQHIKEQTTTPVSCNEDVAKMPMSSSTTTKVEDINKTICDEYLVMPITYEQQNMSSDCEVYNNSNDNSTNAERVIVTIHDNNHHHIDDTSHDNSIIEDDNNGDDDVMRTTNICLDEASFDDNLSMYEITKNELTFDDDDDDVVNCC